MLCSLLLLMQHSQGFLGKPGMDKRMKQPPPKIRTAPAAAAHATDQEYSYSTGMVSSEVISHRTDCRKTSRDIRTIKPGGTEKRVRRVTVGSSTLQITTDKEYGKLSGWALG